MNDVRIVKLGGGNSVGDKTYRIGSLGIWRLNLNMLMDQRQITFRGNSREEVLSNSANHIPQQDEHLLLYRSSLSINLL
jgi:hypothetical protein